VLLVLGPEPEPELQPEPEPEPEPEQEQESEPGPHADYSQTHHVQYIPSAAVEQHTKQLREQLAAAEAVQTKERAAAAHALAQLERHKAALVEAEMEAVVQRSESQRSLAGAISAERAEAARHAAARDAAAEQALAALRQELAATKIAHAQDKATAAATRLELDRIAVALSAAEVRSAEAKREKEAAAEAGHAGAGRLRRASERAQRSETEVAYLRRELGDVQKAHDQEKAAMATTRSELMRHKAAALSKAQSQLAEATVQREREQALHVKQMENLRVKEENTDRRRRKAEANLALCKKRLAAVEAADRRRQQAAAAAATAADEAAEVAHNQRQLAFSERLDAVIAELEAVEVLCAEEKAQQQLELQREKDSMREQIAEADRLGSIAEARETEVRDLREKLQAIRAEKAGVEKELLGATEGREAAVAELQTVRMKANMEVAAMQGMTRGMASATIEDVRGASVAAALSAQAQAMEAAARQQRQAHATAGGEQSAAAGQVYAVAGGEPTAARRTRPERQQADPRAAVRWARIRMQLVRLEGESQRRKGSPLDGLVTEGPSRVALDSLLECSGDEEALDRSFAVTPVREPTQTAAAAAAAAAGACLTPPRK
jgi:hypothetical protein